MTQTTISIHAPHARSDHHPRRPTQEAPYFNPRSSCEERRRSATRPHRESYFNPRSSCEERREKRGPDVCPTSDFNPRSSCEERLDADFLAVVAKSFQSTLLMRGATVCRWTRWSSTNVFQSTLLMRGATGFTPVEATKEMIFQSTLLMRGAT